MSIVGATTAAAATSNHASAIPPVTSGQMLSGSGSGGSSVVISPSNGAGGNPLHDSLEDDNHNKGAGGRQTNAQGSLIFKYPELTTFTVIQRCRLYKERPVLFINLFK